MAELTMILIVIISLFIYFIPTFVGYKKKQANGIILLNIFLGWTILGWLGALIWAVSTEEPKKKWIYRCRECNYEMSSTQNNITVFVCPNCKTETHYKVK